MKLHLFNPDHDIALAANMNIFTAPHAARELRADLGFLPALWAHDGDMVLVEDVPTAIEAVRHLAPYRHDVVFVTEKGLQQKLSCTPTLQIEAWGFNKSMVQQLLSIQPTLSTLLPSHAALETIRKLSNRQFAANTILPFLVSSHPRFVGSSMYFTGNIGLLKSKFNQPQQYFVVKAPWSSSGRGLRYIKNDYTTHVEGWCKNVIKRQGGVMIEPLYNKVLDFGMEFIALPTGTIQYLGLSLFSTLNGAYTGNLIATEQQKRQIIAKYVPLSLIDFLKNQLLSLLSTQLKGKYVGPFGVDMMVVKTNEQSELCIHPCVEINLRRTMGHVALALTPNDATAPKSVMYIQYTDKYRLKIAFADNDLSIPYLF